MHKKVGKIFNEIGKDAVKASDMSYKASLELRKHLEDTIPFQKNVIQELKKELGTLEKSFQKVNVGTNDPKIIAERQKSS